MRIPIFSPVLILLLIAGAPAASAGSPVQAMPGTLDFGELRQGELVNVTFELRNSGAEVRTIRFIDFSEPGLFARVAARIGPGAATEAVVNWDTATLEGAVEGKITLEFDGAQAEPVVVTIRGTVLPAESGSND